MRYAAALPAAGLIAGAAIGLLFEDPVPSLPLVVTMAAATAVAVAAMTSRRPYRGAIFGGAVVVTFVAGGVLISADAWQRAWRPSLRAIFEDLAARERAEADAAGRRRPLDDEASAIVEGTLRADAVQVAAGVSLSLAVDRISAPHPTPTTGGLLLTVTGQLASHDSGEWRGGRRVRLPVRLQRPQRYLDPGVADAERALARR